MAKQKDKSKSTNKAKPSSGKKKKHKVINWHDYNEALKQRGNVEIWIEKGLAKGWVEIPGEGRRKLGRQKKYSDKAITTTLQFGAVFHQKLRQTEGFVQAVFQMMGLLLPVPDFTTLSRRGGKAVVQIPRETKDKVVLIMDSSGLKVYGEGEWKVRKHGWSKHRTWRKFHLAIDSDHEIRVVELTGNDTADSEVAKNLIRQEPGEIDKLAGDGAYDKKAVYKAGQRKGVKEFLIPPQKNAKIIQHGNLRALPHPRDENLRQIRQTTRKRWKEKIGYHVRSLVETAMFRWKTIFGDRLQARNFPQQITETRIKAAILNKMRLLGMPETIAIA